MKRHGPNAEKKASKPPELATPRFESKRDRVPQALTLPALDKPEAGAIQAVWDGVATPFQQRQCLQVIMGKICLIYDTPYVEGDPHGTAVLIGRQFCGREIMTSLNLPTGDTNQRNPGDDDG